VSANGPPVDPTAMIRTRKYGRLLVLAGPIGLVAALGAWCFLTLVPWIQTAVFEDLPVAIGFAEPPWWWPIPVTAAAGLITAFAIVRLPGAGGSVPAEGLGSGPPTRPIDLPGILLAGLATRRSALTAVSQDPPPRAGSKKTRACSSRTPSASPSVSPHHWSSPRPSSTWPWNQRARILRQNTARTRSHEPLP
jgi:hypothetical protein